jgi:hypothetical protein
VGRPAALGAGNDGVVPVMLGNASRTYCGDTLRVYVNTTFLTLRKIKHFLPLCRAERRWNDGSRVTPEHPLFPGCVFVQLGKRAVAPTRSAGALWLVAERDLPLPNIQMADGSNRANDVKSLHRKKNEAH